MSLSPSTLTPSQISALSAATLAGLPPSYIAALSSAQVAALSAAQLAALNTAALQSFAAAQIPSISLATLSQLGAATLANLTAGEIAALSSQQIASLSAAQIAAFSKAGLQALNAAALSTAQVSQLNAATLSNLTGAQLSALSVAAWGGINAGYLSASQVRSLSSWQIGALGIASLQRLNVALLSNAQIASLSTAVTANLSSAQIGSLSAGQVGSLTPAQIQALSNAQLNALGAASWNALNIGALSSQQIAALLAGAAPVAIANMSVAEFDAIIAPHMGSLAAVALPYLTAAQAASLTTAQVAAMSAAPKSQLAAIDPVIVDTANLESGGALSYSSMLKILDDAASGGMTATKFAALKALVNELNVAGGISTPAYVQQLAQDVILGNAANTAWTAGANTPAALGNLTATSSQAQVNELIGKWFLGTDLPSINVASTGAGSAVPATYQTVNLPLFSATGPSYKDVNQGNVGDCYFVSALAEVAFVDPSLIQSMIQPDGGGVYSVAFHVGGQVDYVTVNNQFAVMSGGYAWNEGSTMEFANGPYLWAAIVEKAYAELMAEPNVTPGFNALTGGSATNANSYASISGGYDQGIGLITGQSDTDYTLSPGQATSGLAAILASALGSGQEILLATGNGNPANLNPNLAPSHMFEVLGVNAAAGSVLLQNPWNNSIGGSGGQAMQFTISLATLAADSGQFFVSTGHQALI